MPKTKRKPTKVRRAPADGGTLKEFQRRWKRFRVTNDRWKDDPDEDLPVPRKWFTELADALLALEEGGFVPPELYCVLSRLSGLSVLLAERFGGGGWRSLIKSGPYISEEVAIIIAKLDRAGVPPPPRKALESVWQLHEEKVSAAQIAKMHGLTIEQVWSEIKTPGTICGDNYIAPSVIAAARLLLPPRMSRVIRRSMGLPWVSRSKNFAPSAKASLGMMKSKSRTATTAKKCSRIGRACDRPCRAFAPRVTSTNTPGVFFHRKENEI